MPESCSTCEAGQCVCSELEDFLVETQNSVGQAAKLTADMFDVSLGRALTDGELLINIMIHPPGPFDPNDPALMILSLGKDDAYQLINSCIRAYGANWEMPDND